MINRGLKDDHLMMNRDLKDAHLMLNRDLKDDLVSAARIGVQTGVALQIAKVDLKSQREEGCKCTFNKINEAQN